MKRPFLSALLSLAISSFSVAIEASAAFASSPDARSESSRTEARTRYGDKWAVVVGVSSHSDPALNTVLPLHESARRVSESLTSKGFASDHVLLLQNRGATRQSILSSISSGWLAKVSRKNDLVFIFIGTQCFPSTDGNVYLLPYDTRLANFFPSVISVDELLKAVKANVNARDVVLVFQTSFSGTPEMMAGLKSMFGRYNISIHHNDLPENFTVLCSSKPGQPTWGTYFSDNLAEDMTAHESLHDLFNKVRTDTVNDTTKDCAGCKIQTPIMLTKGNANQIALGARAEAPVTALPREVELFLKGQALYARGQSLLDEYRIALRKRQDNWSDSSRAVVLKVETSTEPSVLSEELRKKVDQSIDELRAFLKEGSDFAPGHYLLGRFLQMKEDYKAALEEFREAVKYSPEQSSYHAWLARAQEKVGKDSKSEWQAAYKFNNKSLSAIDNLAERAEENGDLGKASDLLNQALTLYPGDAGLRVRLSMILLKQGKIKQAVEQGQEAVFLDEHSFDALVNLGNLLVASKDERAAHAAYREALELGAPESDYYFVLAQGLEKTNDPEGAIQAFTKFVDGSAKDDKRVDEAKKRLDELKKASQ